MPILIIAVLFVLTLDYPKLFVLHDGIMWQKALSESYLVLIGKGRGEEGACVKLLMKKLFRVLASDSHHDLTQATEAQLGSWVSAKA